MTKEGKEFSTHNASDEEYRKKLKEKLIITRTTKPTIAIVLYCLFKYAFAPI